MLAAVTAPALLLPFRFRAEHVRAHQRLERIVAHLALIVPYGHIMPFLCKNRTDYTRKRFSPAAKIRIMPRFATAKPAMNPAFRLFGLAEQFDLDTEALHSTYRRLAARFHPDKTASASAFEQKQAVMMAAALNDAYRRLANPLDRAALLLETRGIDADAPEHTAFAPEFLMQQMAWREALAEAQSHGSETALNALDAEILSEEERLHQALSDAFRREDGTEAADLVRRGRFLAKLRQEIRSARDA